MRWSEFEDAQPVLAEFARTRLMEPGVVLLATIRSDGTPRLSAVEPYLLDDDLMLAMLWGSQKARDLLRDPRVLVHTVIRGSSEPAGEVKLRGRARPVEDVTVQTRYSAAVAKDLGWRPEVGRFHLYAVDLRSVAVLRYAENGDQTVTLWPAGTEYLRRATSVTSLGRREPVRDLLR